MLFYFQILVKYLNIENETNVENSNKERPVCGSENKFKNNLSVFTSYYFKTFFLGSNQLTVVSNSVLTVCIVFHSANLFAVLGAWEFLFRTPHLSNDLMRIW